MAHIKEPKGIDFIIQSPPLTDNERKRISEFIKQSKSKRRMTKRKRKAKKETV